MFCFHFSSMVPWLMFMLLFSLSSTGAPKSEKVKDKKNPNNDDVYAMIIFHTFVACALKTAESCSHLSQHCTWILCVWTCWISVVGNDMLRAPGTLMVLVFVLCHARPSPTFDGCVCVLNNTESSRTLLACVSSSTYSRGSMEGQWASLFKPL